MPTASHHACVAAAAILLLLLLQQPAGDQLLTLLAVKHAEPQDLHRFASRQRQLSSSRDVAQSQWLQAHRCGQRLLLQAAGLVMQLPGERLLAAARGGCASCWLRTLRCCWCSRSRLVASTALAL